MPKLLFLYTLPLILTALTLGAARFAAGPTGWVRYSAAALAISFLVAWGLVVSPDWVPNDPVSRIGHIVVGAAMLGVALDMFWPALLWRRVFVIGFALGCAWLSVTGTFLTDDISVGNFAAIAVLAAVWSFVSLRIIAVQGDPPTGIAILFGIVGGLAVCAAAANFDIAVLNTLALLAAALVALAATATLTGTAISPGATLVVSAASMGCAWSLVARVPGAWTGIAVLLLIPFADRTARRVPMPNGGISSILYVLVLIAMIALPALLAGILIFVARA